MTDNEIIKALECCGVVQSCKGCPYKRAKLPPEMFCQDQKDIDALDLINRQNKEIDILTRKNDALIDVIREQMSDVERLRKANGSCSCLGMLYSEIKSEARKEFAERLKCGVPQETGVIRCADIDNLLEEMEVRE